MQDLEQMELSGFGVFHAVPLENISNDGVIGIAYKFRNKSEGRNGKGGQARGGATLASSANFCSGVNVGDAGLYRKRVRFMRSSIDQ